MIATMQESRERLISPNIDSSSHPTIIFDNEHNQATAAIIETAGFSESIHEIDEVPVVLAGTLIAPHTGMSKAEPIILQSNVDVIPSHDGHFESPSSSG
jgi:hypothetical protein